VRRAFPSWNRLTLVHTGIHLCHACSDHEIEDGNAPPGAGDGELAGGQSGAGARPASRAKTPLPSLEDAMRAPTPLAESMEDFSHSQQVRVLPVDGAVQGGGIGAPCPRSCAHSASITCLARRRL
jgi:hypothetical protein